MFEKNLQVCRACAFLLVVCVLHLTSRFAAVGAFTLCSKSTRPGRTTCSYHTIPSTDTFPSPPQDLVKGIRNHKSDQAAYISKCLSEIRDELKTTSPKLKAQAVSKLMYLQMLGYDSTWASFNIIEVMSQPMFKHKRIGYLAVWILSMAC